MTSYISHKWNQHQNSCSWLIHIFGFCLPQRDRGVRLNFKNCKSSVVVFALRLQIYRSERAHDMRFIAITTIAQAILADIFLQCIEGVQRVARWWASSSPVRARRAVFCRSPRQCGRHQHLKALVALETHLLSSPTFRKKQGRSRISLKHT